MIHVYIQNHHNTDIRFGYEEGNEKYVTSNHSSQIKESDMFVHFFACCNNKKINRGGYYLKNAVPKVCVKALETPCACP